ncbi:MAG: general secretion pathway protein GspK [Candidatus Aureabacteria bacterium]|nr:general secretion pathway protein GspK [Candidatus Auribacterota bacterium]
MISRKASDAGFSVLLIVVILFSAIMIFSVIISFAGKLYRLEKVNSNRAGLDFAARSGINVTLENLLSMQSKGYTSFSDISQCEEAFRIGKYHVRTFIEDENSKINIKDLRENTENIQDNYFFNDTGKIISEILSSNENNEVVGKNIEKYVTFEKNLKLNLNTAHKEILALFFKNRSDLISFIKDRVKDPLKNITEVEYMRQECFCKNIPFSILSFTVKSNCFTIISIAKDEKRSFQIKAVYKMDDKKANRLRIKKN